MHRSRCFAVRIAIALWAVPGLSTAACAAGELQTLESLVTQGLALLEAGYQRVPMLVLVLGVLLILPAAAVVSYIVHVMARRRAERVAVRAAEAKAQIGEWTEEAAADMGGVPAWPKQAWISIEGGEVDQVPIAGSIIRIGRSEDNDIRLPDSSVHRYHAVIQRTPNEEFVITDLSGKEGNGLRVNGQRLTQAQLADGDLIELGRARLKFESIPV